MNTVFSKDFERWRIDLDSEEIEAELRMAILFIPIIVRFREFR